MLKRERIQEIPWYDERDEITALNHITTYELLAECFMDYLGLEYKRNKDYITMYDFNVLGKDLKYYPVEVKIIYPKQLKHADRFGIKVKDIDRYWRYNPGGWLLVIDGFSYAWYQLCRLEPAERDVQHPKLFGGKPHHRYEFSNKIPHTFNVRDERVPLIRMLEE